MKPLHGMPVWYGLFLFVIGGMIYLLSSFIIAISNDHYLWWQVILSVQKSPFILIVAWGMMFLSFAFMVIGAFIIIVSDKKVEN